MENIKYIYPDNLALEQVITEQEKQLQIEILNIQKARGNGYSTEYASIYLPFDQSLQQSVMRLVEKKKQLSPKVLVVIGIGGSNLGARALYDACRQEVDPSITVYWAETVDSDSIFEILTHVQEELAAGTTVILNVISKSGTTTETIALFECFLQVLKKYHPINFNQYIVVTTDKDSPLWQTAQQEKFEVLEIPALVVGRYSVLSAVGLFPLALVGINIVQMQNGAAKMVDRCASVSIQDNPAAASAAILYAHFKKGFFIHNLFLFCPVLENVGKWYRQLLAESIGKESDRDGKKVHLGITPTVSIGSTDLHSIGQLYLAGPYNTITTFVTVEKNYHEVKVPAYTEYEKLVGHIQARSLSSIMDAIFQGVIGAYGVQNRPYMCIELPEKKSFYIAQLMQYKMLEIMYLGYLLHINPFDQPNVELYKKETRKILAEL